MRRRTQGGVGVDEKGKDRMDLVDTQVGFRYDPAMKGNGFNNSIFLIFANQTPKRLQSDRFYTTD